MSNYRHTLYVAKTRKIVHFAKVILYRTIYTLFCAESAVKFQTISHHYYRRRGDWAARWVDGQRAPVSRRRVITSGWRQSWGQRWRRPLCPHSVRCGREPAKATDSPISRQDVSLPARNWFRNTYSLKLYIRGRFISRPQNAVNNDLADEIIRSGYQLVRVFFN